ncbi:MAG TPA: lysylphosphatidylglycerol synthase transmembrane domain-containing protein [Methylomirabilota bacterium]
MRWWRPALLALGLGLLTLLIVENDPEAILAEMGRISWRLAIVVCFPHSLVVLFDTLGWRFAFARDVVPFRTLTVTRLAGEAFNAITPTATIGGEAVKAWLLRGHAAFDEAVASVIVAKTSITIAQALFLLVGVALASWTALSATPLLEAMGWLFVVEAVALASFVFVQTRGVFGRGAAALGRLGVPPALLAEASLERVDAALAHFYRGERRRFALSIACHFVAWLLGAVETYLILRFLGVEVSWVTATVIEAIGAAVRLATFVIPASVGAVEGGFVATFGALGLGSSTALAFGLARRVREVAWIAAGLVAFATLRPVSKSSSVA